MIFTSQQPRILSNKTILNSTESDWELIKVRSSVPENLTVWNWLFESEYAPLRGNDPSSLAGFTNATTKERIRYDQLKDYGTFISTALVKKFKFSAGETIALFSPNTVWYPVAMFATIRIGRDFPRCDHQDQQDSLEEFSSLDAHDCTSSNRWDYIGRVASV